MIRRRKAGLGPVVALVLGLALILTGCQSSSPHPAAQPTHRPSPTATALPLPGAHTVADPVTISHSCAQAAAGNAEVTQAVDAAHGYVYEAWIGCGAAAFARSSDGGRHFDAPVTLPGSAQQGTTSLSDGPAIAVAPDGTVYVTFAMVDGNFPVPDRMYPVVDVSVDHGASFPQSKALTPPGGKNFADRPYIAVDAHGAAYVTWDYSPRASSLVLASDPNGSGYFKAGDINLVVQKSTDQGHTWSPIQYLAKGSPAGKIIAEPDGRIDILYIGHQESTDGRDTLGQGQDYFISSTDGGAHWSAPVGVGPDAGDISIDEWWIDGALSADAAGNLYAAWDTQVGGHDESWLSQSTDRGVHWSAPVRVTADTPKRAHILELAGGQPGVVYVAWLTGGYGSPYSAYLRPYSIAHGWLSDPIQLSTVAGDPSVWPGDTLGVSVVPGSKDNHEVVLSWGTAPKGGGHPVSQIYGTTVSFANASATG